jgi:hypothetical protein
MISMNKATIGTDEQSRVDWFTVVKVPIAKIKVAEQIFRFLPMKRFTSQSNLYSDVKRFLLDIQRYRKNIETKFYEEARLYNYLTGEELPITTTLIIEEFGWLGWHMKSKKYPVTFRITLHDKMWNKDKQVLLHGYFEVYSLKVVVRSFSDTSNSGRREEIIINNKKFLRYRGLFSNIYDPFIPESHI